MSLVIDVSDALRAAGLTFRRFRGSADYPTMVAIMNACNEVDRLDYNESVEDVVRVFKHLTNCDPSQHMLFAEMGGEPVAYSRVFWKDEHGGPRLYVSLGFVVPAWQRRGLGTAILQWNETRLRAIAADHPPESEKAYQAWTTDGEPGAIALLESCGCRDARRFVEMIRSARAPIAPSPIPAGLEVRTVRPSDHRDVWGAWEEAYRGHWRYTPRTDEDYARWKTSRRFQPHL